MSKTKNIFTYFTKAETALWLGSVLLIVISFIIFDGINYLTLAASLIGVTSLIFCAKGNPFGQLLMIFFGIIYGIISYRFAYYGEMITYLGMTGPMAVFSLISWLKNPYGGNRSEVKVNRLRGAEIIFMLILTAAVTVIFYFILDFFGTANLIPSTLSVTTSFIAVYLTFRRSAFFPLAYAANDVILIVLWSMASFESITYISVLICFIVFLINDIYGFISWSKRKISQSREIPPPSS
ncbi:MAG: nicotinamide mononucleotide transporter [Clostridia bacterium]|nr:nicotinamide mononucleotide transporter [Clostridia bacterium]